jgi:hypothetical protein
MVFKFKYIKYNLNMLKYSIYIYKQK